MPKKAAKDPADYILPLYINGLEGRMLRLPAKKDKTRELLFVYGQHSSLERWWGAAELLSRYGTFTMPDLPGFGGMTSLYKIGQKPTIDNLADYLATFLKLKFKRKKVTVVGMSLGFVIVTRMLQKYPQLTKKVDLLVSVVGCAHKDDFIFSKPRRRFWLTISIVFSMKLPAFLFHHICLNPFVLRRVYHRTINAREKFAYISGDEFKRTMDMEIRLWAINDIRTQMKTYVEMMTLDNTQKRIDLPVWHVASKKDRYFNNIRVEEHMRRIFNDFHIAFSKDSNHAPTIIADMKTATPFFPEEIKRQLRKMPD